MAGTALVLGSVAAAGTAFAASAGSGDGHKPTATATYVQSDKDGNITYTDTMPEGGVPATAKK